ncbi:MAG: gliding motility-associated C-terminal domain-containing protein, partial [Bacteroidota bacterium]
SANLEVVANASAVECGVANSGSANVEVQNPTAGVEYTYRWSDDNTTANRTGLMPGIYMVTVTSSEGCTNVQELIIESEALTLQLENITNIDCEGNLGTATVSVPNAENITYTWNDNATGATRNELQAGTYTVMATDAAGCEATQTLTIEVATNVAASFELEESMDCETGMITLVATNTTEGNVANLEWQYGEETVQGQENITIELNPNLNPILDIRLNASSADGCLATTTQTFSAMEFVLNVEITNSVEVCENEIVELEVVNNNADMTLTYEWSPASAFEAGTINQAKPNFIADSSTDVTVTVMNSMGCSIAQTIPVTIAAITAPDLSAFNYEESCLGNIVRFSSTEDLSNYTWNFGDPNNPTTETGASEYEFTYSDAGEYTLTLTPNENALCQEAVSTNIVVEGARDLAFTLDGATEFCGSSNPITVTEDFETINWYAVEDTENPLATGAEYTPEPGTYLVEVVNEEGCVGQQEITVTDNSPSYTLLGNQNICVGDELQLNLETENVTTVTWSPNDPLLIDDANSLNPIFTLDETTIFTLTVTNGTCLQTEQITIEVNDLPEATATADLTEIFIGQESNLDILGNGEYTVTWNNTSTLSRDDVPNPVASPEETTVYGVTIEDENGCFINDEVEITVLVDPCDQPHIFVPNAFTPNRDGVNDVLYVRGLHIDELDFVVHNRWGQQVFHTTDKNIGWDGFHNGDLATGDAFGWYLEVTCFDGTTTVLKGNVTLIR